MTDGAGEGLSERQAQLVVVGSSAGGIDALSTLVSTIPAGFPAPIVLAQHLDPRRPSHLAEILSSRSTMPVRLVEDSAQLEPGVVFVVPSNRHVEITDSTVGVTESGEAAPRPSVDRLFESAAHAFGEGLIAVILSGTGSDGAAGARHVKAAGGTVVIQDPASAPFPEMPQSLAPSNVDIVASIEAIGPLLFDLLSGTYEATKPEEDRLLRSFLDQIRERTGIDFSAYKRPTITRRLQRRMVATGTSKLRDYVRFAQTHPDEAQRLSSSFLIKVTEFFRDPELFDYLRTTVMPGLIEHARSRDSELRIWSAGCATGEEAYSLAILVAEALGDEIDDFAVRIFATDLDAHAINYARRGVYPRPAMTNLPKSLVDKYFTQVDGEYEIKKEIRALTVFGQHDLGQRAPFPRIDLCLCRNVLIYFTPELQKRALQLFAFSLRDDGYLVLGKAETTSPLAEYFVLEQPRLKLYVRRGERVLIPPARIRDSAPIVPIRPGAARGAVPEPVHRPGRETARAATGPERAENVLLRLSVGVVLIDESYDIEWINASARRVLGIHTPAVGHDFVHLAPLPSPELRSAIDAAFRGDLAAHRFEVATEAATPARRWLEVSFQPVATDAGGANRLLAVIVDDLTASTAERLRLQGELDQAHAREERVAAQLRQLTENYMRLLQANEELTTANAELRSSNEELLVANEEVQAATEEVETLNEELQATNEELETLNEELQATVEELNTANDDLEARTVELQDVAASLADEQRESEASRARLEAALEKIGVPVLVVDARGRRVLVNRAFAEAFPPEVVIETEAGEPMTGSASVETASARTPGGFERVVFARGANGERLGFVARAVPVAFDGQAIGSFVLFDGEAAARSEERGKTRK